LTRPGIRPTGRTTARAAFYSLVVLALGLLASLAASVAHSAPIYEACKSLWDNSWLWLSSLGVVLPLVLASSVVLMAGVTLMRQWRATRHLLGLLAVRRVPVPSRLTQIAAEVGLAGQVESIAGVAVSPFCYGLRAPRVCVPVELLDVLDDPELRAMLRHEAHHAHSRDPLKIWLSRALARGLFFLPVAADLRDSYLAAKELAADETTTRLEELPLASALVKILSAGEAWPDPAGFQALAPVVGNAVLVGLVTVTREAPSATEARIRRLVDGQPVRVRLPSLVRLLASGLILAVIFVASHTNLSAAAVVPVSPECAIETTLVQPAGFRTWTAFTSAGSLTDTLVTTEIRNSKYGPKMGQAGRTGVQKSRNCSLLTPHCPLGETASVPESDDGVIY
jgi:Zn-dependent protease with chaperone function